MADVGGSVGEWYIGVGVVGGCGVVAVVGGSGAVGVYEVHGSRGDPRSVVTPLPIVSEVELDSTATHHVKIQ